MFEEQKRIRDNFRQEMLNTHNYLRQLHGVPPLMLDDQLNESAQTHAEDLAQEDSRPMPGHRKVRTGENVYSTTAINPIQRPDGNISISIR